MRRGELDTAFRRVRDIRLALAGLLVLSMAGNLALTVGFAGRETVTVLVPAVAGPAWQVGGGGVGVTRAGARYLEDMARTVAVTLLTLTPENATLVRLAAARLAHASARGAIGAWVEAEASRMAGRDMASAFYPTEIEADPHVAALVKLVRAVARREPLPGYAIHADLRPFAAGVRLIETWRGPRFRALVLEAERSPFADRADATAGLAGTIEDLSGVVYATDGVRLAALWLAAPGTGPSGGRLAVAVLDTAVSEASR